MFSLFLSRINEALVVKVDQTMVSQLSDSYHVYIEETFQPESLPVGS